MSDWLARDLKHLWHPYTQMRDCSELPPILIERAEGLKLYDNKDNFYYDTISSWWCNIHGHNHPKIRAAIDRQLSTLDHVLFAGFTHRGAIELAERLVAITPKNLTRVFYSDNGSTAVETALKMSLQYWRNSGRHDKTKFVSLDMGYHGDTIGAMSVAGNTAFNKAFEPVLFDSFKTPTPYCYRCPLGKEEGCCSIECIGPLEKILKETSDMIAAIILEPLLLGAAGMIVYPAEFLRRAAGLAKKYDVHLIADEVATGFGRTGKMFACEHAEIAPDFLCLSKGITSGTLPFAATLTTEDIYSAFYDDYEKQKTFYHGHTYCANPVGCAAALANLDIFEQDSTLEKIQDVIELLRDGTERFRDLPLVGDVRGIGMVAAFELVRDKSTKRAFETSRRVGLQIYKRGLAHYLILRPLGNVTYLFLPLCTSAEDLEIILERTYCVIESVSRDI
jgi:adenosylmethionine-8-amino-7-oxononanoate transaminase